MPPTPDLLPGAFMFTTDGALAGLVIEHDARPALVPGDLVLSAANRLRRAGPRAQGRLGLLVQGVTPALLAGTGASSGVIVTAVDPTGPAAGQVDVTDVVEAVDDEAVGSYEHWEARMARLAPGDVVTLHVRHRGGIRDVSLTAVAADSTGTARPLGLTMRAIPQVGAEIVQVDPWSAAAHASLRAGDVITVIGSLQQPTPNQVRRAYASMSEDRPILVAITRGEARHVFALEKR
jgi:S1-C subfamily serine protease